MEKGESATSTATQTNDTFFRVGNENIHIFWWPTAALWAVIIFGSILLVVYRYFFDTQKKDSISDIADSIDIIEEFR